MTPGIFKAAVGVALVLGLTLLVATCVKHEATKGMIAAQQAAAVAKGRADTLQAQAEAAKVAAVEKDRQAAASAAVVQERDARVAALKGELDSLRAGLPNRYPLPSPPSAKPGSPPPAALQPMGLEDQVIVKQDEVIQAQTAEIAELKTQVGELTAARDQWHLASDHWQATAIARDQQARAQEQVTREMTRVMRADHVKTGLTWGIVGAALGAVCGHHH